MKTKNLGSLADLISILKVKISKEYKPTTAIYNERWFPRENSLDHKYKNAVNLINGITKDKKSNTIINVKKPI